MIDIKATEYAIFAPDSVPAGVITLRLTQTGDARKPWPGDTAKRHADPTYDFHMVWLVRLDSGKTASDLYSAELRRLPTPWAASLGGVGFADPPHTANATLRVAPGNYVLVCYVGSAREDRTRYHLLKGMMRPLVVVPPPRGDTLPRPDISVILDGDSVIVPQTLVAGRYVVAVRNTLPQPADFEIRKLKPGRTTGEALAWRPRLMTPPPVESVGGVVAVPSGGVLLTDLQLDAGDYLFNATRVAVR